MRGYGIVLVIAFKVFFFPKGGKPGSRVSAKTALMAYRKTVPEPSLSMNVIQLETLGSIFLARGKMVVQKLGFSDSKAAIVSE